MKIHENMSKEPGYRTPLRVSGGSDLQNRKLHLTNHEPETTIRILFL